jgi:hypothetical protein
MCSSVLPNNFRQIRLIFFLINFDVFHVYASTNKTTEAVIQKNLHFFGLRSILISNPSRTEGVKEKKKEQKHNNNDISLTEDARVRTTRKKNEVLFFPVPKVIVFSPIDRCLKSNLVHCCLSKRMRKEKI